MLIGRVDFSFVTIRQHLRRKYAQKLKQ